MQGEQCNDCVLLGNSPTPGTMGRPSKRHVAAVVKSHLHLAAQLHDSRVGRPPLMRECVQLNHERLLGTRLCCFASRSLRFSSLMNASTGVVSPGQKRVE